MDGTHDIPQYKYNRDILLQLRMHPLSLKKPDVIKIDVVKDKLNLHQINNWNSSQTLNMSNCGLPHSFSSMKLDADIKCCNRTYQEFFPWRCPFNGCGKKAGVLPNGILPCKSWQFATPNFISPLRKNCLTLPDYLCDSSTEDEFSNFNLPFTSWPKQSSSNYCSQPRGSSKACLKNEKKVLPIIDPSNGKNILDSIEKISPKSEDDSCNVDKGSNSPKSPNRNSESGDTWENGGNDSTNLIKNQESGDSDRNIKSSVGSFTVQQSEFKDFSDAPPMNSSNDRDVNSCISNLSNVDSEEFDKDIYKQGDFDKPFFNDGAYGKIENQQKLNLLLKEKLYSLRREQQKMTVYQSFLQFKKHQIEDGIRNLEEKRVELGNWECNWMIKAKELQEKDCKLEAKKLDLQNREERLDEREQSLIKKENLFNEISKVHSDDNIPNKNDSIDLKVTKEVTEPAAPNENTDGNFSDGHLNGSLLKSDTNEESEVEEASV